MVGEIEVAGDLITGTLVGRAVEAEAGEGRGVGAGPCLNCGGDLIGAHCHQCGQKSRVHRTLAAFGHDIAHSVLHFDGKIWRTLPLLAWRPGELTRRYIHGERAKFVSPIALFLFTVFLTFAVFNRLAPASVDTNSRPVVTAAQAAKELAADRAETLADIKELEQEKRDAVANGDSSGVFDSELKRHRANLKRLDTERAPEVRRKLLAEQQFDASQRELADTIADQETLLIAAKKAGKPTTEIEDKLAGMRFALKIAQTAKATVQGDSGVKWNFTDLNFAGSKALNAAAKHAAENPQLLIYKIQSNAYKFSWALIPISVPFVWLLFFWRRKFKLFDHAVFVTYSLCFMMMLGVVGGLILSFADEDSAVFVITVLALIFFPPIHIYRQLHRAYETTRFGAIWRTFILSNFAVIAMSLFITLILALGVTG
jgi:hypothetical protein